MKIIEEISEDNYQWEFMKIFEEKLEKIIDDKFWKLLKKY